MKKMVILKTFSFPATALKTTELIFVLLYDQLVTAGLGWVMNFSISLLLHECYLLPGVIPNLSLEGIRSC